MRLSALLHVDLDGRMALSDPLEQAVERRPVLPDEERQELTRLVQERLDDGVGHVVEVRTSGHGLPAGEALVGGYGPGESMVKTWTFVDGVGVSHNLWISGEIRVDARTGDRLSGAIEAELRVPDGYPPDNQVRGTLSGRFEAEIVDCSGWKGPYPL